ncbi:MAG: GNAT family N-acetyltransferase [Clostridia bacterium]|nr:GNAT family N-acetyltransferase [Clostridia bacterium]
MADIFIRPAVESDIPRLEALLYQVHGLHAEGRPDLFIPGCKKYTADQLRTILSDTENTPVFAAVLDGVLVGYCFCIRQVQTAASMQKVSTLYIDDLCVDRAFRGRGIGKALYDHTVAYAREQGYYNVTLNVWACNPSAMRFYEKCGLAVQKIGMELVL